jgi:hypothetical protein
MTRNLYKTLSTAGKAAPTSGKLQKFLLNNKQNLLPKADAQRRRELINKWGPLALVGGIGSAALGMYANRPTRKPGELPVTTHRDLLFPIPKNDGIPPYA